MRFHGKLVAAYQDAENKWDAAAVFWPLDKRRLFGIPVLTAPGKERSARSREILRRYFQIDQKISPRDKSRPSLPTRVWCSSRSGQLADSHPPMTEQE